MAHKISGSHGSKPARSGSVANQGVKKTPPGSKGANNNASRAVPKGQKGKVY